MILSWGQSPSLRLSGIARNCQELPPSMEPNQPLPLESLQPTPPEFLHIPVLSQEVVAWAWSCAQVTTLDATVGGGGHSSR